MLTINQRKNYLGIFFFLFLLGNSNIFTYAQTGIENPYSRFGLGEMSRSYNHPYMGSMGGVAYTVKKNSLINPFNPASYMGIDTLSFVFDIGATAEYYTLKDSKESTSGFAGNLSHLMFGFPCFKWWKTSIGILPMSSVNYSATTTSEDIGTTQNSSFKGEGGITKVYWGNAFHIWKGLSAGFNINFLFGDLEYMTSVYFPSEMESVASRFKESIYVTNFTGDLGIQYFTPIKDKYELGLGFTYAIPNGFKVKNTTYIYTYNQSFSGDNALDTVTYQTGKTSMRLPQSFGFGASFAEKNKWFVGADVTYTDWSTFHFADIKSYASDNTVRFSLGGEYTPNYMSSLYIARMSYRAGFHYEPNAMRIDNNAISDMGVHFGLTLPTRKRRSGINLSFEYGQYGTTDNNLVQKNYFKIGISLSTADIWFVKPKYD